MLKACFESLVDLVGLGAAAAGKRTLNQTRKRSIHVDYLHHKSVVIVQLPEVVQYLHSLTLNQLLQEIAKNCKSLLIQYYHAEKRPQICKIQV